MPKTDKNENTRQNWGRFYKILPKLDLLSVQKESYRWFKEDAISEIL